MPTQPTCQGSQPPVGPRSVQYGHLDHSFPLSVTWCRSPMTKSEILLQRDCPNSLRCRLTVLPLRPPKPVARPQRKEGIHVRTFSTHHGISLAGLLLPRPWTLKTSRPRTAPRGFPVSHSPEVLWDMQLAHFTCSLLSLPHRLIWAEGQTHTHT